MVAAFQQQRSDHGIGASEIASIVGENPWETAFELWARKVGETPPKEPTEAMEIGLDLEGAILSRYERKHLLDGRKIERATESVFHPSVTWARCTPDAWIVRGPIREAIVQAKNVGAEVAWKWRNGPPAYVVLQVQWELFVTGMEWGDIAALVGGNKWMTCPVRRDDDVIKDLVETATRFWRCVETKTPPPADDSDACGDYWMSRAGQSVVANDPDLDRLAKVLREEKAKAKECKSTIKRVSNLIAEKMAMAGANRAQTAEGFLSVATRRGSVSWKKVAEHAGLVALGDSFRGKDSQYLVTPKAWGSDDDE